MIQTLSTKTFFTSDTHFGHSNIIKHCCRLEFATPEEREIIERGSPAELQALKLSPESTHLMDETMIQRWNAVVSPGDVVYHLGDIFLYKSVADARAVRARLHGTIRLLLGNHDGTAGQMRGDFDWVKDYAELRVPDPDGPYSGYQKLVLFHYALRVWNGSHHGSWHLYGHSHNSLPDLPGSRSFDVGVDGWDYAPVSYERIKARMALKTCAPIDPASCLVAGRNKNSPG